MVARFQGGPNAGHTLEFDGIKHVLHQIPSGIFREDKQNIIGNGVVLDPVIFMNEVSQINKKFNISLKDILSISTRAQLISPVHRLLDKVLEENKGKNKIGSTLKGLALLIKIKLVDTVFELEKFYQIISKKNTTSRSLIIIIF